MFTGNEDMGAVALREQAWSISATARDLGRDRRTIRDQLNGTRVVGERCRHTSLRPVGLSCQRHPFRSRRPFRCSGKASRSTGSPPTRRSLCW